jgi:hypothetical protein
MEEPMRKDVGDIAMFEVNSVGIDPLDLNKEFTELPPQLAYWNAQYARATKEAMQAKASKEREEARVLLLVRETAKLSKEKITLPEVDARVSLNEDVQDAQDIYLEKEAQRIRVKGIVDAILTKRDMLQSLGAKVRVEMMADPTVRDMMSGGTIIEYGNKE